MVRSYALVRAAVGFMVISLALGACSMLTPDAEQNYPKTEEDRRKERNGRVTGEEGMTIGGAKEKKDDGSKNPLSVNSFLWRATLDTIAFMPITSADPWGGTILTDWYEDPAVPGERTRLNVLILDRQLRADSLKISTFRQKKDKGQWVDAPTDAGLGRKLEDTVLTRARELRVKQLGY